MLDLTRLARGLGFVFLGYFLCWPVIAVLDAVFAGGFDVRWFEQVGRWWTWPVPAVFPVLSAVLAVDFFRRLRQHQLRTTQVGGYRFVAFLLAIGAGFALPRQWEPMVISGLFLLLMLLPARARATAPPGETTSPSRRRPTSR